MTNKPDIDVNIGGTATGLQRATAKGITSLKGLRTQGEATFKGLGQQIGSVRGLLTGLAAGFSLNAIISATAEQERVTKSLANTIRATGREQQITTQQVMQMAGALQGVTRFGDEAIAAGQEIILTYRNIGNDVFPQVSELALDVAEKFGKAIPEASRLVARSLEAPQKGMEALLEVGVSFDAQQQEQIKTLVASGRIYEAQQILLGGMEQAFGGAARAARDSFAGSMDAAKNALGDLLEGDGDGLKAATEGMNDLADALSDPDVKTAFNTTIGGVLTGLGKLVGYVPTVVNTVRGLAEELASLIGGFDDVESRLNRLVMRRRIERAVLANPIVEAVTGRDLFGSQRRLDEATAERDAERNARRRRDELTAGNGMPVLADAPAPGSTGGAPALSPAEAKARAAAAATAASGVFRAELDRSRSALDASLADNLISYADYYAQRQALELSAVDREIAARQSTMGTAAAADQTRLSGEIEALAVQRLAITERNARELAAAERKLADEVIGLQQRLLDATGRGAEARTMALETEFEALIARLELQGDAAGVALAEKLFNVEVARAELDEVEQAYARVLERTSRAEQRIQLQATTGALTEREARQAVLDLHRATADELEALIPQMQALAAATGDPEAIERLEDIKIEIEGLRVAADGLKDAFRSAFRDGLGSGIADVLNQQASIGDALSGLFKGVLQRLNQQIADDVADIFIGAIKGAAGNAAGGGGAGGGGSGLLAQGASLLASLFHTGGTVGGGAMQRSVPALAFAGAPRYHSGGVVGLAPDERAAVLKVGETVRTPAQERAFAGERMPPVNVTIMANDPGAFRRTEAEVSASIGGAIAQARRRNR